MVPNGRPRTHKKSSWEPSLHLRPICWPEWCQNGLQGLPNGPKMITRDSKSTWKSKNSNNRVTNIFVFFICIRPLQSYRLVFLLQPSISICKSAAKFWGHHYASLTQISSDFKEMKTWEHLWVPEWEPIQARWREGRRQLDKILVQDPYLCICIVKLRLQSPYLWTIRM